MADSPSGYEAALREQSAAITSAITELGDRIIAELRRGFVQRQVIAVHGDRLNEPELDHRIADRIRYEQRVQKIRDST